MLTAVLSMSVLLGGCIKDDRDSDDGKLSPEALHVYKNTAYVYSTAVDESVLTTSLSPAYLILVNKTTSLLDEGYVPTSLSSIDSRFVTEGDREAGLTLESGANRALYAMLCEMGADGVRDIAVTSAYRSYTYQNNLFQNYQKLESSTISQDAFVYFGEKYIYDNYTSQGKNKLSAADALAVVLSYSARPGTSEHQTGLCVDFVTEEYGDRLDNQFEKTGAFAWLRENAYKFGFVLRYPKDKVDATGYSYEPWHYRFVGREAATDMHFAGLCLEEYLNYLE